MILINRADANKIKSFTHDLCILISLPHLACLLSTPLHLAHSLQPHWPPSHSCLSALPSLFPQPGVFFHLILTWIPFCIPASDSHNYLSCLRSFICFAHCRILGAKPCSKNTAHHTIGTQSILIE